MAKKMHIEKGETKKVAISSRVASFNLQLGDRQEARRSRGGGAVTDPH